MLSGSADGGSSAVNQPGLAAPPPPPPPPPPRSFVDLSAGMPLAMLESSHHLIDKTMEAESLDRDPGRTVRRSTQRISKLVWRPVVREHAESAVFRSAPGRAGSCAADADTGRSSFRHCRRSREVTLIIDTSGSMQGQSIEQAREALLFALDRLARHDRFNLIEFNSGSTGAVRCTGGRDPRPFGVKLATLFARWRPMGVRKLLMPLDMALTQVPMPGYLPQVVFVTDGQVGNTQQIIDQVRATRSASRACSPLASVIGVNSQFLADLARFGRGSNVLIGDLWQVQQRMSELVAQLTSPVLHDIELHWPGRCRGAAGADSRPVHRAAAAGHGPRGSSEWRSAGDRAE